MLLALLVISAMGINRYQDTAVVDQELIHPPKSEPDLYMINATITQFDKLGQLRHRIRADKFTHYPLTDITRLLKPHVILYNESDPPWQIESLEGRILPTENNDIVELWDEVFAKQKNSDGQFIHIRTDFLTIIPADDYAETDQIVTINDNNATTTAAGMVAHFNPGRFQFFSKNRQRVTTVIQESPE